MEFFNETLPGMALKSASALSPVMSLLVALALAFVGYLVFDALYWRQRIRRIKKITESTRKSGNGDGTAQDKGRSIVMRPESEVDAERPRGERQLKVQSARRPDPGTTETARHIVIQWSSDDQPLHRA